MTSRNWQCAFLLTTIGIAGTDTLKAEVASSLPEGPNRELVIRTCGECHPLSNLTSTVGRTRERWNDTLDEMVRLGAKVNAEQRGLILDYLAASLGRR